MNIHEIKRLSSEILSGDSLPFAVGRENSLEAQFALIRPEFAGGPTLCYELAKRIVLIRRGIEHEVNIRDFFRILEFATEVLCQRLSTRWLVSVCDTIADHGRSPSEKANAICISLFINLIKLAETESILKGAAGSAGNEQFDSDIALERFLVGWPHSLGDGMTSYHPQRGDMPRNLLARIEATMAGNSLVGEIFAAVLERVKQSDNLLSRMAQFNPGFWQVPTENGETGTKLGR